jgi:hypothetical protein
MPIYSNPQVLERWRNSVHWKGKINKKDKKTSGSLK